MQVLGDPASDTHPLTHLAAQISVPGWHKLRCRRFAIAHRPWSSLTRVEFAWFDDHSAIVTIAQSPSRPDAQLSAIREAYFFPFVTPHAAPSGAPLVTAYTTDIPPCPLCRLTPRASCPCPRAPEPLPPPSAAPQHLPLWRRCLDALAQFRDDGKLTTTLTVPGTHGEPLVRAKITRTYSLAFGDPQAVTTAIHLRLKQLLLPRPPPMPPPHRPAAFGPSWTRAAGDMDNYLGSFADTSPDRRLHPPAPLDPAAHPDPVELSSCSPATPSSIGWASEPLPISRFRLGGSAEQHLSFAPPLKKRRAVPPGSDALPSPFMSTILNVSRGEVPLDRFSALGMPGGLLPPATDAIPVAADRKQGQCVLPSPLSMILDFNDEASRKRARVDAPREDILPLAFDATWDPEVVDDTDPLRRFRGPLAWPASQAERPVSALGRALGMERAPSPFSMHSKRTVDERGRWAQTTTTPRRLEQPLLAPVALAARSAPLSRNAMLSHTASLMHPSRENGLPGSAQPTSTTSNAGTRADGLSQAAKRSSGAICDICHVSFSKRANLVRHTKTVHNNVKPFECKTCRSRFGLKADLHRHVRNIHEKRAYCCRACGRSYAEQEELDFHYRVTHEKDMRPFECGQCGMRFGRRSSRRRHEQTVHTQRRFCCTVCDKSYSQRFDAIKHGRKAHGIERVVN